MRTDSVDTLEQKVRAKAEPLAKLVETLVGDTKPVALRSYGNPGDSQQPWEQFANFDNVESPIPWHGEDA